MAQTATPSSQNDNGNLPGIGLPSVVPSQITSREVRIPFFIYLVHYTVKEHNQYILYHGNVVAFPTLQQANQEAISKMKKQDCEEWKRSYNGVGCAHLKAETEDGRIVQVVVTQMRVRWPGEKGEGGEEDERGEEEEQEEEHLQFEEEPKVGKYEDEESR